MKNPINLLIYIGEEIRVLIFNIAPALPPFGSGYISGVLKINLLPEFFLTKEGGRGKQIDFHESGFSQSVKSVLLITFLPAVLSLSSCMRLDDMFYNANYNPIDRYLLDEYTGPVEFELEAQYDIDKDKIHLFTLQSDLNGDKKNIYALYLGDTSRIATDTVILYCHGNKDHLDFYYPRTALLANTGGKNRYGVMSIDYRGFGLSEGKPSEEGLYADVNAALKWLKGKGLTGDRLVMYGFSMGTAPATELTANPVEMNPSALILEAPFASAEVFVQDGAGLSIPGSYIVNLKIDNAEEIKKVSVPFLWIHGTADDFISMESHGQVVFSNYNGIRGQACTVQGAGHSDCPVMLGFEIYLKVILSFIVV